jgi:uncharacterized protein
MTRVALISDNHSYFGEEILSQISDCDQVWHAGDVGAFESIKPLMQNKVFKGVYGNVDGQDVRLEFPKELYFSCEELSVFMVHIGGYPGSYKPGIKQKLMELKPDLFISGHSHILKVIRDKELNLIHLNPGAYGHHGFHKFRTLLKFDIDGKTIKNLAAIELGMRGRIESGTERQ